jgi:hypothetical protein
MDVMHERVAGLDAHKETVVACVRVSTILTSRFYSRLHPGRQGNTPKGHCRAHLRPSAPN